mmetsp:Transcript_1320/g.5664  ORF Transcript_1320/g.5664 Transcript_1320/m.5664 type:complete len:89 (-) Transcript_1320:10413-10679(-)
MNGYLLLNDFLQHVIKIDRLRGDFSFALALFICLCPGVRSSITYQNCLINAVSIVFLQDVVQSKLKCFVALTTVRVLRIQPLLQRSCR